VKEMQSNIVPIGPFQGISDVANDAEAKWKKFSIPGIQLLV
jgi:hypothetical protein